ncbi:FGGY-family carbohydrate kinase [Winogradskyella forsetii]|uniref:FGGY-family carbohydrate kinase n=1 Tax=Winogradskyella forsetii TaxID=2686077 RepID=UPI0015C0E7F5|nr:FGGY family carbohydrate kinase [Winogradskyella forsetii]
MKKVTVVFDIGKTNKKFFLFDASYKEVYKEYISFDEIEDEDGYPTENLPELQKWLLSVFDRILHTKDFIIKNINFSTYGASFVHLDKDGKVLTPLYNYLKPIPQNIIDEFNASYGDTSKIATETASPTSGMLNSGMQLFWLKKTQPEIYAKIKYSLHFPQYLSYLFTGIPLSEYTSIGCHTGLWDYAKNDYHDWVYTEKIDKILPPIVATQTSINMDYNGRKFKIGVGIHDSSAALIPYLLSEIKPFLLLSTGTWSVALNPFNDEPLSAKDIDNNCLNYMRIDGKRVKATRFFMGNEYKLQVKKISDYFEKPYGYHRGMKFDLNIYNKLMTEQKIYFKFEGIRLKREEIKKSSFNTLNGFEEAYHQLMIELLELQFETIKRAIGNTNIKRIYIDGGFTDNDIFVTLMANHFKNFKVRTTQSALGSALGAAMVIGSQKLDRRFLKDNYKMQKLTPLQMTN